VNHMLKLAKDRAHRARSEDPFRSGRLCRVLLAALVLAGAPSRALACEAMTGAEYEDPPESIEFDLPAADWHVAFRGVSPSYARKEFVPPNEDLSNWTQLLAWNVTFGRSRFDLTNAKQALLDSMRAQCPTLQSRDLPSRPGDLLYEWWHTGCVGQPAQHSLMRLIAGETGTHTITYARRGRELDEEERTHWVRRIGQLELKLREPSKGESPAFRRAQLAIWNGEYAAGATVVQKLASNGDPRSQELLGRLHVEGWGVEQDYTAALRWFERARASGLVRASYSTAQLYDAGLGVPADRARAMELYRTAATGGLAQAEARIGYLLIDGLRTPVADEAAADAHKWLEQAVQHGHAHARYWLGRLYEAGVGTERDLARAVALYRQAAIEGEPDAQFWLGKLYTSGTGVQPDPRESRLWLTRAAMQGHEEARAFYRQHQISFRRTGSRAKPSAP